MLVLCGCVASNKSHPEKVRTGTLADFAGVYKNRPASESANSPVTLINAIGMKPSGGLSPLDYGAVDRVKVTVNGKKVTLTCLIGDKMFDEVTYEEGKVFRFTSESTVPLKTHAGAGATKGGESGGMLPSPPLAGAIVASGSLFLNPKGDLVVRTDSTAAMMVFYVAPVVVRKGRDLVFQRVGEVHDLRTGYRSPTQ